MAIKEIDTLSMEEMLVLLRHHDIEIQWMAARALIKYGKEASRPLLLRMYEDDQNVRILSIWALGRTGDTRAIAPIMRALHDDDAVIRMASEGALSRLMR